MTARGASLRPGVLRNPDSRQASAESRQSLQVPKAKLDTPRPGLPRFVPNLRRGVAGHLGNSRRRKDHFPYLLETGFRVGGPGFFVAPVLTGLAKATENLSLFVETTLVSPVLVVTWKLCTQRKITGA